MIGNDDGHDDLPPASQESFFSQESALFNDEDVFEDERVGSSADEVEDVSQRTSAVSPKWVDLAEIRNEAKSTLKEKGIKSKTLGWAQDVGEDKNFNDNPTVHGCAVLSIMNGNAIIREQDLSNIKDDAIPYLKHAREISTNENTKKDGFLDVEDTMVGLIEKRCDSILTKGMAVNASFTNMEELKKVLYRKKKGLWSVASSIIITMLVLQRKKMKRNIHTVTVGQRKDSKKAKECKQAVFISVKILMHSRQSSSKRISTQ